MNRPQYPIKRMQQNPFISTTSCNKANLGLDIFVEPDLTRSKPSKMVVREIEFFWNVRKFGNLEMWKLGYSKIRKFGNSWFHNFCYDGKKIL